MVFSELQQSELGEVPLAVLLEMKFTQGEKLESIVGLQAVVICPWTGEISAIKAMAKAGRAREMVKDFAIFCVV